MDVRFCSVCSSFHSSIRPPCRHALRFPFRIPRKPWSALFLKKSTVYTLETPGGAALSGRRGWLLKLEETELRHMQMLSLSSRRQITSLPRKFPEMLDSLQYRIVEICREYTLGYGRWGLDQKRWLDLYEVGLKAVMHPDCCVWAISLLEVHEGKVCAVDHLGSVSQVDSSFRLRSIWSSVPNGGLRKYLVVSSGDLYVVDRHEESFKRREFRAYRLDRQCGRWEEVSSLGDSAFFICKDCSFAVSVRELDGCKADCIYYADRSRP
ncbi:hypothetical protein ACJRO7_004053 [Eucalyptus globulus]|uniref:KIB1-4 beta-propeller domain-containing protein n=1 Tax=Eucalyptus globulus TaxID=34317 RepID=A0ABD3IVU9_EUCGL